MKTVKLIIIASTIFILSSCMKSNVRAWEKGTLARNDMLLESDAQDLKIDDHIYFSKESSSGGRGFAGGGCGCN